MDSSQSPSEQYHILQLHQEADSPYLYKFAQDQWLWFKSKSFLFIEFGKQIDTININKSNYTCNEDNSIRFMNCTENYCSKKLGCTLPWAVNNDIKNDNMGLCKGNKKFEDFKNIAMNILNPEESDELINEGCFVPNCVQRSWSIRNQRNIERKENDKLTTGFQFEMAPNTKVLVREETKLYTLINFFAEVGGYLGLLLGESLISYLITASKLIQTLKRKFKERCRKADEEPEPSHT